MSGAQVLVFPGRVATQDALAALSTRFGETPAKKAGAGQEVFALKPYRVGDDPRRIAWRRSLRSGRKVVREMESESTERIFLRLAFGSIDDDNEQAVRLCASLAEDLLARGHSVGFEGEVTLAPARSLAQTKRILRTLALVVTDKVVAPGGRGTRVTIAARGANASGWVVRA